MKRRRSRFSLALCLALCSGACHKVDAREAQTEDARTPGVSLDSVRYVLALEAPKRAADALQLTTNRGYQVTLKRALLSTYSAALLPCVARPPVLEPAKEASLWRTLVLPRAHAGHTSQRDPSYVEGGVFEDLAVSGDSELGLRSFPAQRYCRVHYLVAGAQPDKTTHDASLGGVTLLLEGSVRAKDGSETPLRVRTALAHGRTIELSSALSPAPSELSTLEITFTRALAGLLDDLELATASEKEIERGALRNLLAHMKIEARWR